MIKRFAILMSVLLMLGACAAENPAPAESFSAATTKASAEPEPVTDGGRGGSARSSAPSSVMRISAIFG